MDDEIEPQYQTVPTKVCAKCSVQTNTTGEFCPHCGNSYMKKKRRLSPRIVAIVAATVVLLVVAGGGVALKVRHDQDQEAEAAAAERSAEAAEEKQAEEDAAAEAAEKKRLAREEAAVAEKAERAVRASIIKQMQFSITKDAKERVADGELEGPIFYTSCDPLGGGSVDDLTALTTTFDCLAVNEKLDGGQVRGWVFSSTVNWNKGSWSWRLGS
jgi:hypothetical protein